MGIKPRNKWVSQTEKPGNSIPKTQKTTETMVSCEISNADTQHSEFRDTEVDLVGETLLRLTNPLTPPHDHPNQRNLDILLGDLGRVPELQGRLQANNGKDAAVLSMSVERVGTSIRVTTGSWETEGITGHPGRTVQRLDNRHRGDLSAVTGDAPEEAQVADAEGDWRVDVLADQDVLLGLLAVGSIPVQDWDHALAVVGHGGVVDVQLGAGGTTLVALQDHVGLGEVGEGNALDELAGCMAADWVEQAADGPDHELEGADHFGGGCWYSIGTRVDTGLGG